MSNDDLRGRIAVVTGATRRIGIGAAICRALAAGGAGVFFTYWTPYDRAMYDADAGDVAALSGELREMGVRCASMEVDLSVPGAASLVLDAATRQLGPPAILVNNAAYSTQGGYDTLDASSLDAHYAVNVRATLLLSVEFARRFSGDQGGRIINLTSGQSRGPMPGELAYAASKGAVEAFTVSLADAVAPRGITVNAVNPGPTDTGWMSEELRRELLPRFPLGRLGRPEDAARLVAFLAGDAAGWITGQVLHSEGGFRRQT